MEEQTVGTTPEEQILCVKVRPKGESEWLSMPVDDLAALADFLRLSVVGRAWELETFTATRAEIDATPEFDGW